MPSEKRLRSMRALIFLVVGILLFTFVAIAYVILQISMSNVLLQAESVNMHERMEIASGLLRESQKEALAEAQDLASWGETVAYVQGEYPDYFLDNWSDTSILRRYQVHLALYKDAQGQDLYAEFFDYAAKETRDIPTGFGDALSDIAFSVLGQYTASLNLKKSGKEGIFFYEGQPYYICVLPIASIGDRRASGTLTFGLCLNAEYLHQVTQFADATLSIERSPDTLYKDITIERTSGKTASVVKPLTDIDGNAVNLRISGERIIYGDGSQIIVTAALLLFAAVAVFGVMLYIVITYRMLRPIERLSADIAGITPDGEVSVEKYSRSTEFAALSTSINDMLSRIKRSNVSLAAMQNVLNGLDAYLYVSDTQTDEILFINDKMAEHFSPEGEIAGRKCWEVLQQGFLGRCDFCPVYKLEREPGTPVVWEEHNTVTGRIYRNTDTMIEWADKQMAHLQHSVDITDAKAAEEDMRRRVQQQELMSTVAQGFISTEDLQTLIDRALYMTGDFLGVSHVFLARYDARAHTLSINSLWRNPEQRGLIGKPGTLPFGPGHGLYDELTMNGVHHVAYDDAADSSACASYAAYGVHSFMAAPIWVNDALWGVLFLDECGQRRTWSASDAQLARMIGSVLSGAITRSATEEKLIRMSSIASCAPQYIAYSNARGDFEYINQGVMNITGYSQEELMQGGLRLLFGDEAFEKVLGDIIPGVLAGGEKEHELPIVRKDGEVRVLHFTVFTTDTGSFGLGAIATDVTEQRALERELIAAKEQAEQSSKAKGDFLSRMSHEMRTPMNAIIGMTSIAKASPDLERKEYCLDKVEDASKHLLGVINDILDVSKIEANKLELSYSEFDFERMLLRVMNVINFRIDEKKQKFTIKVDKDVPLSLVSDEQRLSQVITNLLSNAVKFTPEEGAITLSVHLQDEECGLCTLRIEVMDNGIGVSKEQQGRLFRSFEQADGGISRKFGGTGLGLAICKSIVEMMGGEVWIESEEGKGSIFGFTVKARRGSGTQTTTLSPDVNWKTLRVLAVDDSADVREYFLDVAESLSLNCDVAGGGEEALEMIEERAQGAYNIVFVDWKMPGMNGTELTRRIKARFGGNAIVIMISATEWSEIEMEAREAGVDRFLPKPLFSSLIVNCINESLGVQKKREQDADVEDIRGCFTGNRILLAEDVEINREIVFALLEDTGVIIDCAEDGAQACEMFANAPDAYDLLFMDIHMPQMDGYEATKRIRAMGAERAATIPIVAMTANVFREDIEKCLAAGMNAHIGKPIDFEEMIKVLKRYLPKKG